MLFKSKYKKIGADLYLSIGEVYSYMSQEIMSIDELDEEISRNESFPNELLFILFFFSTVKVQELFKEKKISDSILNELHNTYYSDLENKLNCSKEDVKNISFVLNNRYSSYNKVYKYSSNIVLGITEEFLNNIKFDHNYNLDIITSVSFWLVKSKELVNEIINKIEKYYKISS